MSSIVSPNPVPVKPVPVKPAPVVVKPAPVPVKPAPVPVKPAPVVVKPAPVVVKPAPVSNPVDIAKQKAQQDMSSKQAEMAKAQAQQDMLSKQSEMAKAKAVENAKMRQDQDMAKAKIANETDFRSDVGTVGMRPVKGLTPATTAPTSFFPMNPSPAVGDALGSAVKTMGMMKRGGKVQTTRMSSMSRSKKSSNW